MAKRKEPEESIPLLLLPEERDLILELSPILAPAIATRLRFGVRDGECLSFQFPRPYVEELHFILSEGASRVLDPVLRAGFEDLALRMGWLLSGIHPRRPDTEPGSSLPPEVVQALRKAVAESEDQSPAGIDAAAQRVFAAENSRPRKEFCGLSSEQTYALVYSNWREPSSALRMTKDIPIAELEGADFLANARVFLDAAAEPAGIKATATGNLNRKFVAHMLAEGRWPASLLAALDALLKVINEYDVTPLETLRNVLALAGLIRKSKGVFRITRAGQKLRSVEAAGALFAALFDIHFRKFNLAYLTGYGAHLELQHNIAYSFYVLSRRAADWVLLDDLTSEIFLPVVAEEIAASTDKNYAKSIADLRILDPLVGFGLLEYRFLSSTSPLRERYDAVRKTPLFDRFLRFEFPEPGWLDGPM